MENDVRSAEPCHWRRCWTPITTPTASQSKRDVLRPIYHIISAASNGTPRYLLHNLVRCAVGLNPNYRTRERIMINVYCRPVGVGHGKSRRSTRGLLGPTYESRFTNNWMFHWAWSGINLIWISFFRLIRPMRIGLLLSWCPLSVCISLFYRAAWNADAI